MKIFQSKNLKNIFHSLIAVTLFVALTISSQNSYADIKFGTGRERTCSPSGAIEGLDFNPTDGGKDIEFVLGNPVCATVIATTYAYVKGTIATMNGACASGSIVPRIKPSPFQDARDILRASTKLTTGGPACVAAYSAALTALPVAISELAIVYATAKGAYDNTRICGANWTTVNTTQFDRSTPDYKQTVQSIIEGYMRNDSSKLSLTSGDKSYREWYYGGVEITDNPDNSADTCYDVTKPQNSDGSYPKQTYYLKGLETGNYNCKKYDLRLGQNDPRDNTPITQQRLDELQRAYACCKKRSQEYVCIEFDPPGALQSDYKFCQVGTRCTIRGITYSAKSLDNGRLACAESYSVCPYNFSVGGGSEYCDYFQDGIWDEDQERWVLITQADIDAGNCADKSEIRNSDCTYNNKAGRCKNYCQYLTHCTKTAGPDFHYISGIVSPYFATACLNFEGDSQNKTAFGGGFLLGSQRHFSAPIAQCVKETLENVFYNVAGHSKCLNFNEFPSADGTCPSGQYATTEDGFQHKIGTQVKNISFFSTIQNTMQSAVKMVLTLSVMFYGMNVLIGKAHISDKKDILVYIVKIGLILYFATGDAWQTQFFKGVYGTSAVVSRMVFKIEADQQAVKRDGCQFGTITLPDGTTTSTGTSYPEGKEYLALWDTLDCKIMRYLGFGPEVSAANIMSLILAGYFTGPLGIYFAISVMFFGFFLIAATIRALHIFLSSCISIIIFVFISPIVIPTALFKRTEGIFKGWLTELISFCFQPIILFAYIAIFVIVMDKTLIGSASFRGQAPSKTMSCDKICKNFDGTIAPFTGDNLDIPPACDQQGQVLIDPMDDSVACLINLNSFGKFPGFELIGLSIPILVNVFNHNAKEKILTLLKAALIMYLLCKFMDEIPAITKDLIGGTALPGTDKGVNPFNKVLAMLKSIQKRGMGAGRVLGKKAMQQREGIKGAVQKMGDKGKSAGEGSSGASGVGGPGGGSSAGSGSGSNTTGGGGGGSTTGGGSTP